MTSKNDIELSVALTILCNWYIAQKVLSKIHKNSKELRMFSLEVFNQYNGNFLHSSQRISYVSSVILNSQRNKTIIVDIQLNLNYLRCFTFQVTSKDWFNLKKPLEN